MHHNPHSTNGTTGAALPPLRAQPGDWTIEEVIQFIESNDSSLAVHGDLFRKHVRFTENAVYVNVILIFRMSPISVLGQKRNIDRICNLKATRTKDIIKYGKNV